MLTTNFISREYASHPPTPHYCKFMTILSLKIYLTTPCFHCYIEDMAEPPILSIMAQEENYTNFNSVRFRKEGVKGINMKNMKKDIP